jgi:hypothetical protein
MGQMIPSGIVAPVKAHNLRVSDELWEQIERRRGQVPRNRWIVGVLQQATEQASGGIADGRSVPAPAESTLTERLAAERAKRDAIAKAYTAPKKTKR